VGHDRGEFRERPPVPDRWGECYQLGPGTIRVAHTAEEHILKADLLRGVELYVRLAADLLAREAS
jgi:Acetylornithine deacetylase/Succinyl-diaminopimelate desuccinylase and related deacylases